MKHALNHILLVIAAFALISSGCQRTPELHFETRTHGFDFVDENGTVLATAGTLDEISDKLNEPRVKSKLSGKVTLKFFHIARGRKGFQVPDKGNVDEISKTIKSELNKRGVKEFATDYENW